MSDVSAGPRFTLDARARWDCTCGCGRALPHLTGTLVTDGERRPVEALFGHFEGERTVFLAVRGTFGAHSGRFALRVRTRDTGSVWSPLEPADWPAEARRADLLHPAEWDDGDTPRQLISLLDTVLTTERDALDHLYGPDSLAGLDFSFTVPDSLLALKPERRDAEKNFASLGERRFVRALLAVPVLGGVDLRIGTWFEVPADAWSALRRDFDTTDAYLAHRLDGVVDNAFALDGQEVFGRRARLAPRTATECLFVESMPGPLAESLRVERSRSEATALVKELEASYAQAMVARQLAKRPRA